MGIAPLLLKFIVTPQKPNVDRLIKTRIVRSKHIFRFHTKKAFQPRDGSLRFSLINDTPNWVTIDAETGLISGMAPKVVRDRQYAITVKAENQAGAVSLNLFIKVILGDVIEEYAQRLMLILSLKKQKQFGDLHAMERGMLEYLYEALMNSEDKAVFIKELQKHAQKEDILISQEPTQEEFEKVIKAENPDIEQQIKEQLPEDHALLQAALTNAEMRALFIQGSQPLGSIPPGMLINALGSPDRHNWSSTLTVLDSAAEAVIKLRTEHLTDFNLEHTTKPGPKK